MAPLPKSEPTLKQSAVPSGRSRKLPVSRVRLSTKNAEAQENGSTIAAAQAKAHFSELLAQVEHDRKPILISKRGKVIAQLIPAPEDKPISNFDRVFGSMRGTGRITGDIVSPDWDAWGPEWR